MSRTGVIPTRPNVDWRGSLKTGRSLALPLSSVAQGKELEQNTTYVRLYEVSIS